MRYLPRQQKALAKLLNAAVPIGAVVVFKKDATKPARITSKVKLLNNELYFYVESNGISSRERISDLNLDTFLHPFLGIKHDKENKSKEEADAATRAKPTFRQTALGRAISQSCARLKA